MSCHIPNGYSIVCCLLILKFWSLIPVSRRNTHSLSLDCKVHPQPHTSSFLPGTHSDDRQLDIDSRSWTPKGRSQTPETPWSCAFLGSLTCPQYLYHALSVTFMWVITSSGVFADCPNLREGTVFISVPGCVYFSLNGHSPPLGWYFMEGDDSLSFCYSLAQKRIKKS